MRLISKRAGSLVEYAIILSVVLFALSTMNVYLKRGIQARVKDATVSLIASDLAPKGAHQYLGGQNESNYLSTTDSTLTEQTVGDTTTKTAGQTMSRSGTEHSVTEGFEDLLP